MILSVMIFTPFLAGVFLYLFRAKINFVKALVLLVQVFIASLAIDVYINFEPSSSLQFSTNLPWIPFYGINYHIGLDGVSLPLFMMTALLMPLVSVALYDRAFVGLWINSLIVQSGIFGALLAQDLMLFYLFWETMLLPIFFMIGIYGYGKKEFFSMKFTIYTIFGSLAMLISILYLIISFKAQNGFYTFDIITLKDTILTHKEQIFIFLGFALAFGIKIPIFPFHTWLADTYKSSPTIAIVILSALMSKLGIYAIYRILFSIFASISLELAHFVITLGLASMLYFALLAINSINLKKLFAYSSASHLSLILVGLFIHNDTSLLGVSLFIASHALSSAAIFIMIAILYNRRQTIYLDSLGGIVQSAPLFSLFFAFFALSIVGIPFTSGFISEVLIILGSFEYNTMVGFVAATSILASIVFILNVIKKTLYGKRKEDFKDLQPKELLSLIPLALLILALGIFPNTFLSKVKPTVDYYSNSSKVHNVK